MSIKYTHSCRILPVFMLWNLAKKIDTLFKYAHKNASSTIVEWKCYSHWMIANWWNGFFGRRFDIWLRNSTMLVNSRNDKGVFCGLAMQWFLKCCIAINGHWTIYFITETFAIVRYGGSMKVGSEKRKLKQPI